MDRLHCGCVLFDLDGTVANTLTDLTGAVNAACDRVGVPHCSEDRVRRMLGSGAKNLMESAAGTHPEKAPEMLSFFRQYYMEHLLENTVPYDGIPEALKLLKESGFKLGVVSNKPDGATRKIIGALFPDVFDYVAGELPEVPRKPDAAPLLLALKTLGVKSGIYVGDSENDVLASENAGMPGLFVTWGFRGKEVFCKMGVRTVDTPAALADTILNEY